MAMEPVVKNIKTEPVANNIKVEPVKNNIAIKLEVDDVVMESEVNNIAMEPVVDIKVPAAGPSGTKPQHRRKPFTEEEKNMILHVFRKVSETAASRKDAMDQCAGLIGVSGRSIYRVLKENQKSGAVSQPKTQDRGRKRISVDISQKALIRQTVHSFFFQNSIPTIAVVYEKLQESDIVPRMGRETLRKLLKELGFICAKRKRDWALAEKQEIVAWRRKYLRTIREFRKEHRKIYYLGETSMNADHIVSKICQDIAEENGKQGGLEGLSTGLRAQLVKGQRLVVSHIGSDTGFLSEKPLVFVSKHTRDHGDMDAESFENWFAQVLEHMEPNSVIVMDNAPCHSRLVERIPTIADKKVVIQSWLTSKGIHYFEDMVKPELIVLVNQHRPASRQYVVDNMAQSKGITVLRLPPYHCQFNPIELVWAQVKLQVMMGNTTFKPAAATQLLEKAIQEVTPQNWQDAIAHLLEVESEFWKLDGMMEELLETFVISTGDSDSSSEESDTN